MSKADRTDQEMIWAYLLHLSFNMWADREVPEWKNNYIIAEPHLRFDDGLYKELLARMSEAGINMLLVDLGDGVRYESHPEIAVKKAWSPKRLKRELDRVRKLGLEPIPKLNFSTCHDVWLGPYARCVSTDAYYAVCADLIAEVIELFDHPRFFHLGMDEETAHHQRHYEYVVIRQFDLWWRDFYFLVDQVEKGGSRAWIWSDYVWEHPEVFFGKMPRSVLQSNWYYGASFARRVKYAQAYVDLEAHGYDQVPTGSNWSTPENFGKTVRFCAKRIDPTRLKGFMTAPWKPTLPACRQRHLEAIQQVARARTAWNG